MKSQPQLSQISPIITCAYFGRPHSRQYILLYHNPSLIPLAVKRVQYHSEIYSAEKLRRTGIPMVIFDRDCPNFEADKVVVDSYHGAYQAVEYLIKTGRQHIAHIAGPIAFPTFKQRLDGYLNAHYDNNIPIRSELIAYSIGFSSDFGVNAATQLMATNDKVDAIFAVNDAVAIGAMQVIRGSGYRIPEDISLVGFDDESYAQYYYPSLSTVWQPVYELGMLSAKILLDRFASQDPHQAYRYEVLKPELVTRDSSTPIGCCLT